MKTLYLHVGLHKTATTSIQNTLLHNRDILIKNDFFVPVIKVKKRIVRNHTILFYNLFGDNPKKFHTNIRMELLDDLDEINESFWDQLENLVSVPQQKIIMSGEGISNISENGLAELKAFFEQKGFRIKVICAVREGLSNAASRVQQMVQDGYPSLTNISNLCSQKELIINRLKTVKAIFPDTIFYSFEKSLEHAFGPVGYFLELVGVPNHIFSAISVDRANDSISDVAVRIMDHINSRQPFLVNGKINPNRTKNDLRPLVLMPGPKFFLRQDEIEKIIDKVKIENAFYSELTGYDYTQEIVRNKTDEMNINQRKLSEQIFLLPTPLREYAYEYAISKKFIEKSFSLSPISKISTLAEYHLKKLFNI